MALFKRWKELSAEKEAYLEPTRKNIEDSFRWLMRGIEVGDSLFFYFSGHGLRQRGCHGDEIDGFDETICPLDFETNGMIFDNYINQTLVNPLIKGVTLHAIVDSCHSGTVLDLPLVYNINTYVSSPLSHSLSLDWLAWFLLIRRKWDDNSPEQGRNAYSKGTSGGKAICFSACEDYQQAADTSVSYFFFLLWSCIALILRLLWQAFSTDRNTTGAMTCTFIKAVKTAVTSKRKISYREILLQMHESLKREDHGVGCARAHLRRVFTRKIMQVCPISLPWIIRCDSS